MVLNLILVIFLSATSIHAKVKFAVTGPCDQKPILNIDVQTQSKTVGEFTVNTLITNKFEFIGDDQKIESIAGTPVGSEALEIISRSEMRAYGWCFYVDGKEPEVYPHEMSMKGVGSVHWLFAYAHYKDGEWLSMCNPSWALKPDFLCK